MADRQATLFHGSACKCRKSDHVPGRVNMRKVSLKELVHFHLSTRIGRQAGSFQMELIAIGLAADSINKSVALYSLAALQLRKNTTASGVVFLRNWRAAREYKATLLFMLSAARPMAISSIWKLPA